MRPSIIILVVAFALGVDTLFIVGWLQLWSRSSALKALLAAEDLDDLGDAEDSIMFVTPGDAKAIRDILKEWDSPQAVSNLLMYPNLIPEDVRLASIFRGLDERKPAYYVVATVVGLARIKPHMLSREDREGIASKLLAIIREAKDVRATRASAALGEFLRPSDAPLVIALTEHQDETVRHNLKAWLLETFKSRGVDTFAEAVRKSELPAEAPRRLIAEFQEFGRNHDQMEQVSKTQILYAYIPNLKEYQPD